MQHLIGDKYAGIDMEIAGALAEYLGVELVVQNMDFDAVCLSVGQHKCDVAMAGLTVKPDREEYVTFSDSYYSASQLTTQSLTRARPLMMSMRFWQPRTARLR